MEAKAEEELRRANFHETRADRAEDDIRMLLRRLMQQALDAEMRSSAAWESSIDWMQRAHDAEHRIRKSKRFIAACTLSTDKDLHRLGVQLNQNLQAIVGQEKVELDERLIMWRADAVAKKHRQFLKEQDEVKRKGGKPKKTVVSSTQKKDEPKAKEITDDESSAVTKASSKASKGGSKGKKGGGGVKKVSAGEKNSPGKKKKK